MVRVAGLVAFLAPALGARVESHDQAATIVARGLELLEQLKENPADKKLQTEYSKLVGDVEFHESRIFLETGVQVHTEPEILGDLSVPGNILTMVERTGFDESLGRFLTNRRDYVWEEEGDQNRSKYVLDGRTMSLHSRMFVSIVGEESNPRFILRRAFSFLNPISGMFGQFVYRVIKCLDAHEGQCSEGETQYTITKDRLGRGALWGMDEYRVYTGTGGCSRWGGGIVSCDQEKQVMYSLGSGLAEASFDTTFYKGNIVAIHGNGQSGTVYFNGREMQVGATELAAMRLGHSVKVAGPPRWLNWVGASNPIFGAPLEVARAAIWSDSYRLTFHGEADELLVSLMASAEDLTRDMITSRQVAAGAFAAHQAANHVAAADAWWWRTAGGSAEEAAAEVAQAAAQAEKAVIENVAAVAVAGSGAAVVGGVAAERARDEAERSAADAARSS